MSLGHRVRPCHQTKQPSNQPTADQISPQQRGGVLRLGVLSVDSVTQSGVVLAEKRCPVENQDSEVSC